jgi:uncharacterized protein
MLKVELRSLEHEDLVLDERGWAKALGIDLEPQLCSDPLEIHCELSKTDDLISAKGWVKGKMQLACDRCLREFESPYKSYFEVRYRAQGTGEDPEGVGVYPDGQFEIVYFEGQLLDVADQIRQTILLSVPMRVLCKEDCRGLCGGCGVDLNLGTCRCSEPPPDPRWSALKNWKVK